MTEVKELIKNARIIADSIHVHSSFQDWEAAEKDTLEKCADALEAAEARIAKLEAAPLPKEGKWIRKEVKVYCPRDCWNPSACAIEGTWNEEEGWNLEMKDGFCSVCGEQDEQYYKHHYCPNCGAKMKTVTDCHTSQEANDEQTDC